ncbi:MAG: alcohol dehydrogenase catalytic domain-containing protein [Fimbriimonas sp.]
MQLARYIGNGNVAIVDEPRPFLPVGGLLVRAEACGLCSGELMSWYMDRKIPHVLGHEVAGIVEKSDDARFPVGSRVFPHHHAPCLECEICAQGHHVHCPQWKRTKLDPGGMSDYFAVSAENLNDCLRVDDLRAVDAALIEPLACVMKSLRAAPPEGKAAVIGLGVMGLMHALMLKDRCVAYDLNPSRVEWAKAQGIDARHPDEAEPGKAEVVFVCPGVQAAFDLGVKLAAPGGTIVMFAPLGPGEDLRVPQQVYFNDLTIRNAFSCGPRDTEAAAAAIRAGNLRAEQVVSDFVGMEGLPAAYLQMKRGEILKAMVVFPETP